jgi:hypothetical protein
MDQLISELNHQISTKYSTMNCNDINSLDIVEILKDLGYSSVHNNESEYLYLAHFRNDTKPSLSVNRIKGRWYDHGTGFHGTLIDLLMLILNISDVGEVLAFCRNRYENSKSFSFRKPQKSSLKEKKKVSYSILQNIHPINNSRLKGYLRERGISESTWSSYLEEIHYENQHGKFFAVGFKNDSAGYEIRNSVMKKPICLGKKDITTIPGRVDELVMFEGFMDFLSFVEMKKFNGESIIVLNSTAKILSGIDVGRDMFSEAMIKSYFDNDKAGQDATQTLKSSFDNVVDCSNEYSDHKDLNELLQYQIRLKIIQEKEQELKKRQSKGNGLSM